MSRYEYEKRCGFYIHRSIMWFLQMAQLSTTMSQAHSATAFHCCIRILLRGYGIYEDIGRVYVGSWGYEEGVCGFMRIWGGCTWVHEDVRRVYVDLWGCEEKGRIRAEAQKGGIKEGTFLTSNLFFPEAETEAEASFPFSAFDALGSASSVFSLSDDEPTSTSTSILSVDMVSERFFWRDSHPKFSI
jgi:hypothetical protein